MRFSIFVEAGILLFAGTSHSQQIESEFRTATDKMSKISEDIVNGQSDLRETHTSLSSVSLATEKDIHSHSVYEKIKIEKAYHTWRSNSLQGRYRDINIYLDSFNAHHSQQLLSLFTRWSNDGYGIEKSEQIATNHASGYSTRMQVRFREIIFTQDIVW